MFDNFILLKGESDMFRKPLVLMLTVLTVLVLFSTFEAKAGTNIVVPNANEAVDGNASNGFPFNCAFLDDTSQRYQQMYASSEFEVDSCFITEIRFRSNSAAGDFGPTVIPNINIQLSTSSNNVTKMTIRI